MKVRIKISVTAAAIVLLAAACGGGGGSQKQQSAQNASDKMIEQAASKDDFAAGGKTKIAALGKSEKDKRLVVRFDAAWGTQITVFEWKNSGGAPYAASNEYTFLYASQKANFNSRSSSGMVTEINEDGLWFCKEGETVSETWQQRYDGFKKDRDYKIIE
jgi:hypothetical protein